MRNQGKTFVEQFLEIPKRSLFRVARACIKAQPGMENTTTVIAGEPIPVNTWVGIKEWETPTGMVEMLLKGKGKDRDATE